MSEDRLSLPPGIYLVGLAYVACGALCLLLPSVTFTNPWPMGIVFFAGELTGGAILLKDLPRHDARSTNATQPNNHDTTRKANDDIKRQQPI